jgi:hypothetical protein
MLKRKGTILLIVCAAVLLGGVLEGREDYMLTLPVYRRYMCTNCHISPTPTAVSADLNLFGRDFRDNSYIWNNALAVKDSDGDNYANGIEVGDENGDGVAEIVIERSNPGDPLNNPNSIDKDTWGIIKSLFKD